METSLHDVSSGEMCCHDGAFLAPSINIAAVKAIMSGTTRRFPSVAMQQSLNPSLFHLASQPLHLPRRDSQKFCPASELFPAFDCQPHQMQPMDLFSGSPLAPTPSSDLLPFWEEDPNRGGDRIAEQFWGDIFAELLQLQCLGVDTSTKC